MKNKTYQAIVDALRLLATGQPVKTNGKLTGVNVAREAGVSKATLYRNFEEHTDLQESYDNMRRSGPSVPEEAPKTLQQAYRLLKQEVKELRAELGETKRKADQANKLKAHQIQLLWSDNERLKGEVAHLRSQAWTGSNVVELRAAHGHTSDFE